MFHCRLCALSILVALLCGLWGVSSLAEPVTYTNPLLRPEEMTEYVSLPKRMLNILLLGIDFGSEGYRGSAGKTQLLKCHTDAIMVLAINLDDGEIDIVSLPRDTLTYVPGVKGIYKLNAAFNCGETVEEGLEKACEAASWVLGDIKMDAYCAVDMETMIELCDAIGGVDFSLEMAYTGHSGNRYSEGMQHLDGVGITDYMRARTNAKVDANDIGRTGRQRDLMLAIMQKLSNDPSVLLSLMGSIQEGQGIFFNLSVTDAVELLPVLGTCFGDRSKVESHVITGPYITSMGWNFTFTDQEHRQEVIREVYGVDVPELAHVSYEYSQWLWDRGFNAVHSLAVADRIQAFLNEQDVGAWTEAQRVAIETFAEAHREAATAFEAAADDMTDENTAAVRDSRQKLQNAGDQVAKVCRYRGELAWSMDRYWYVDTYINEVQPDWR